MPSSDSRPTKRPRVDQGTAAPSETVSLSDETPGASFQAGLARLWRNGESCDVTIRVPGGLEDGTTTDAGASVAVTDMKAHRVVLAAVSEPLDRMIFGPMASVDENNVLTLTTGIAPAALRSVVEYAYSGTLEFTQDTVWGVLEACMYLELDRPTELCTTFLSEQLTRANALGVAKAAEALHCAALEAAALAFAQESWTTPTLVLPTTLALIPTLNPNPNPNQAEADRMTLEITVPSNHKEGAKYRCLVDGAAHIVRVPAGAAPGARLRFKVNRSEGIAPAALVNRPLTRARAQVVRMSRSS